MAASTLTINFSDPTQDTLTLIGAVTINGTLTLNDGATVGNNATISFCDNGVYRFSDSLFPNPRLPNVGTWYLYDAPLIQGTNSLVVETTDSLGNLVASAPLVLTSNQNDLLFGSVATTYVASGIEVIGVPVYQQSQTCSIYEAILGRAPDQFGYETFDLGLSASEEGDVPPDDITGAQNAVNALNAGVTRASVALGIMESPEATQHLAPQIEFAMVRHGSTMIGSR